MRVCRTRLSMRSSKNTPASTGDEAHCVDEEPLFYMSRKRTPPLLVTVKVNGELCEMEVDTGAGISLVSEETYRKKWKGSQIPVLRPSDVRIQTYTGETVRVLGVATVTAEYGRQTNELNLCLGERTQPPQA